MIRINAHVHSPFDPCLGYRDVNAAIPHRGPSLMVFQGTGRATQSRVSSPVYRDPVAKVRVINYLPLDVASINRSRELRPTDLNLREHSSGLREYLDCRYSFERA